LSVIKKKKIARDVLTRIVPICRRLAATSGHRLCSFGNDDYLLGIVVGMSDLIGRIGSGNTLSDADVRLTTFYVIDRLFGRNGAKAAKRAMKSQKTRFRRGVKNGQDIVVLAARGNAQMAINLTHRAMPANTLDEIFATAPLQRASSTIAYRRRAEQEGAQVESGY